MALALVLTPQPLTASVLIQVTGAATGAAVITRTDANGTGPVRLRVGQVPIAGALTVTDYEPALLGTLTYDVVDFTNHAVSASTTLADLVTAPVIASAQLPGQSVTAELVTGYTAGREAQSTVHRIVGRGDPVIVLHPTRTREGRVEVWCRTYEDALAASDVLALARVLLLRQPDYPGLDMYFIASRADVTPLQNTAQGWRWQASADYVEVRNPAAPLLGAAGWTFDDVAGYASFASVRAAFDDFDALLVGV